MIRLIRIIFYQVIMPETPNTTIETGTKSNESSKNVLKKIETKEVIDLISQAEKNPKKYEEILSTLTAMKGSVDKMGLSRQDTKEKLEELGKIISYSKLENPNSESRNNLSKQASELMKDIGFRLFNGPDIAYVSPVKNENSQKNLLNNNEKKISENENVSVKNSENTNPQILKPTTKPDSKNTQTPEPELRVKPAIQPEKTTISTDGKGIITTNADNLPKTTHQTAIKDAHPSSTTTEKGNIRTTVTNDGKGIITTGNLEEAKKSVKISVQKTPEKVETKPSVRQQKILDFYKDADTSKVIVKTKTGEISLKTAIEKKLITDGRDGETTKAFERKM